MSRYITLKVWHDGDMSSMNKYVFFFLFFFCFFVCCTNSRLECTMVSEVHFIWVWPEAHLGSAGGGLEGVWLEGRKVAQEEG